MQDSAITIHKYNFSHSEDEKIVALNLDHVFSVFVILIVGLSMGFVCFVIERMTKSLHKENGVIIVDVDEILTEQT